MTLITLHDQHFSTTIYSSREAHVRPTHMSCGAHVRLQILIKDMKEVAANILHEI